jgi:6-phosphofructokinase 1
VIEYYHELKLDALVALGGDGTMSMCHELTEKGMKIVGVPKTIDNDLRSTDRTFGFDTAVAIATDAVDRLQTTGQAHGRVMILETMGRYAGWIALYAGVAGSADVILIPEIPYSIDDVVATCKARSGRQRFTIIVIAEGAMPQGGTMSVAQVDPSSPDPIRLGGIGNVLRRAIEQRAPELEVRTTVLGHIQRGGSPTPFDRLLATQFGAYAASLVASGQVNRMVALQDNRLTSVPLHEVAHQTRTVPRDALMIAAALAVGTSFGDPELRIPLDGLGDGVLAQ